MKLIKQIQEERELLHKMMEALVEERAGVDIYDAAKGFACLFERSEKCLLTIAGVTTMLTYAILGILVAIVKLFRRNP